MLCKKKVSKRSNPGTRKIRPIKNACNKLVFNTRKEAKIHSKKKYKATTGTKYSAYLCPTCNMYHLTTRSRRTNQ